MKPRPRPTLIAGRVVAGRLEVSLGDVAASVRDWPDGEVVIVVRTVKATRSLIQNAYYWGVCLQLVSDHTGYTPEEVHDLAKQMFLPKALALTDGNGVVVEKRVIGGSTTKLNTGEMSAYVDRFREWAASTLGVVIPDPREVAS